ncbi:MAG: hypothetical protein AUK28_03985 [Desulfobacterales bacterium CG2_30_60_27]|nr:MAG: hypothetical protein AUK28_03985 [Desulfobacterales bacterium CG2_30_60_27]
MHPKLVVVLVVYLLIQSIENLVALVNLKYLKRHGNKVPPGFTGFVEAGELARIQAYTLAQGRLDFVAAGLMAVVTLIFFFGPLLNWYNGWLAGLGLAPVAAGLLCFLLLSFAETLLQMPTGLYHTFGIEERFGFNTQTLGLWLADLAKSLLLSTVLLGLLLAGGFWLMGAAPHFWWLFFWMFFCGFSVFLLYLSPYVIEPLFNKFTPLDNPELEEKIRLTLSMAGIAVARIFVMDASRRSRHGNACFSGIGRVKRIVLFDTLLTKSDPDEIVGILAHEAGHWKKHHILQRLVVMELFALAACYLASRLVAGDTLASLFGLTTPTVYGKLLVLGFLGSLAGFVLRPLSNAWSRLHEWQADDFATRLTNNGPALATALVKLGRDNLANLHPHPWYVALHYGHPPLADRVARLLNKGKRETA